MNPITELIEVLGRAELGDQSKFKSYTLLREALVELDQMVEMYEAKAAIVLQLKFIIKQIFEHSSTGYNSAELYPVEGPLEEPLIWDDQFELQPMVAVQPTPELDMTKLFDGHMLHTVIYGPPGVGKSKLGEILAKFYSALGILKKPVTLPNPTKTLIDNLVSLQLLASRLNVENVMKDFDQFANWYDGAPIDHNYLDHIRNILKLHAEELSTIITLHQTIPPKKKDDRLFRVVSRPDFVAGYLGQSAIKTMELLNDSIGKVLFIDEAYSLIHDEKDSFGMEVLTVINLFMSQFPYDLVIIFGGYRDLLEQTIFKFQPGLRRRCTWIYEVKPYTPRGLSQIFVNQLKKYGWTMDSSVDLVKFFTEHHKEFPNFGGDTDRLSFYCKLHHHDLEFINVLGTNKRKRNEEPYIISKEILRRGLKSLQENRIQEEVSDPPFGFYA